jgi:FAD:protein FMN transferase
MPPPPDRSSRRDFLRGRSAARALREIASDPIPPPTSSGPGSSGADDSSQPTYLLQLTRRAMACNFQLYLNATGDGHETDQAMAALDLVEELESQLSVYRPQSEVSRLNAAPRGKDLRLEPQLWGLLLKADQIFRETGGAFDITAGPLSKAWGFFYREGRLPDPEQVKAALAKVGGQFLVVDPEHPYLRMEREGLEINLASIGKGYALDRCHELLLENGVADFLLHGGTSSVIAAGSRRDSSQQPGWQVGVPHPLRPDRRIGTVQLKDAALGTSGAEFQAFFHKGKRYGHVLDPRTGYPAQGVLSSTVIAPDAATADALATACYVMGPEETTRFSQRHAELGILLVMEGEKRGAIKTLRLGQMPELFRPDPMYAEA